MSTKIYKGYKYITKDSKVNINDIISWCVNTKNIIKENIKPHIEKDIALTISDYLDSIYYKTTEDIKSKIQFSKNNYNPLTNFPEFYRNCIDTDFNIKCTIHTSLKNVLIIFFYENDIFYDMLPRYKEDNELELKGSIIKGIQPYPYYNNTDSPIDIEEWDKRGKEWKEALPTGIPSIDGLMYNFYSNKDIDFNFFIGEKYEELIKLLYEERLNRCASNLLLKDFDIQYKKHGYDITNVSLYIKEYKKYSKTEDYEIKIKEKVKYLRQIIPKTYKLDKIIFNLPIKMNNGKYVVI